MKKKVTAAELMARLNADPDYVARKRERDDVIERESAEYARAEVPLVQELCAAGVQVSSVWDLVNSKTRYPQLIPILMAHLDHAYPDKVREGIARALAIPESRSRWDQLVARYLAEADATTTGVKWALHSAIAAAADGTVLDTLIQLASDRRHGRNRALFADALARIDDPRAKAALLELARDPDLAGDVQRVIRKKKRG